MTSQAVAVLLLAVLLLAGRAEPPRCLELLHFGPAGGPRAWSLPADWPGFEMLRRHKLDKLTDRLPSSLGRRLGVPLADYLAGPPNGRPDQLFWTASTGAMPPSGQFEQLVAASPVVHPVAQRIQQRLVASVGLNGSGSIGHRHKQTWFALAHGRKLWQMAPPEAPEPKGSACGWTGWLSCVQSPGDLLWLPDQWWHQTCNIGGYTVGVGAQGRTDLWPRAVLAARAANLSALGGMSVEELVQPGPDGANALHHAASWGHTQAVRLMLDRGVPADSRADRSEYGDGMGYLLQAGEGRAPLHFAAQAGRISVLEALLEAGCDPTATDSSHSASPAHLAAHSGHLQVLERLERAGAPLDPWDANGLSPYDLAKERRQQHVAHWLEQRGARGQESNLTAAVCGLVAAAMFVYWKRSKRRPNRPHS